MHLFAVLVILVFIFVIAIPIVVPTAILEHFNNRYGFLCALIAGFLCLVSVISIDHIMNGTLYTDRLLLMYYIGIPSIIILAFFAWRTTRTKNVYSVMPPNYFSKFWAYLIFFVIEFGYGVSLSEHFGSETNSFELSCNPIDNIIFYIESIFSICVLLFALFVLTRGKFSSAPSDIFKLVFKYGRIRHWYVLEHFRGQCIISFKKKFYICGKIFDKKDIVDAYGGYDYLMIETTTEKINVNLSNSDDKAFQDPQVLIQYFEEMANANKRKNNPKPQKPKSQKTELVTFEENK